MLAPEARRLVGEAAACAAAADAAAEFAEAAAAAAEDVAAPIGVVTSWKELVVVLYLN